MADASPVSVPLVTGSGETVGYAQVDQSDLDRLRGHGVVNNWFLGHRKDRVLVKPPAGNVTPVDLLIMEPKDHQTVVFKDGDPTNLTRDNLILAPRKTIDILLARQRRR